jgi:hypothetical protein
MLVSYGMNYIEIEVYSLNIQLDFGAFFIPFFISKYGGD